jgi:hypothetical protein
MDCCLSAAVGIMRYRENMINSKEHLPAILRCPSLVILEFVDV